MGGRQEGRCPRSRPTTIHTTNALLSLLPHPPLLQDYVAATLQAYLRRCGVASSSLKRYPSYSQPQLVANQVGGPAVWWGGCGAGRPACKCAAQHAGSARAAAAPLPPAPQWTLRRVAPLPPGYDWQRYQAWAPDYCPLAEEACT